MDELQETFNKFFSPNDEVSGAGTVQRVINGELHTIIVDQEAHDQWLAEREAAAEAAREEQRRIEELMLRLNF